ncbi:MAG TPA: hypothetical protein VF780_05745 [Nitrosospira sp.]
MTRREELEARGEMIVAWYYCFNPENRGFFPLEALGDKIGEALLQVEREALERVAEHLEQQYRQSHAFEISLRQKGHTDAANDMTTQKLAEQAYAAWCRQQAEELK